MKKISRRKIEQVIEYRYFKNLSLRETSKLVKISKTTVLDYYNRYLLTNLRHQDVILLSNKDFNDVFYKAYTNKSGDTKKVELKRILDEIFIKESNKTQSNYWDEYKKVVKKPYGHTQFSKYFNEWLNDNNLEISYNLLTLRKLKDSELILLKKYKKSIDRNQWRKAKAILDLHNGKSKLSVAKSVEISNKTLKKWIRNINEKGIEEFFTKGKQQLNPKIQDNIKLKKSRLIEILHQSPSLFNINRTSWREIDLAEIYHKLYDKTISTSMISQYLKEEGYVFKKAKKVLTSPDPNFREKLAEITKILSGLKTSEKFFSIDEYGPFAIKIQGGRTYSKKDEIKTYPQLQKSKGSLILTGALELSTNQMTHFYSDYKNTDEMIKLMYVLLEQYKDQTSLYLSWDAASWHISKKLVYEVEKVNSQSVYPKVYLAPLPSSAQFLNVIESVFSGMAKAIIHNSNYKSVEECKNAIDRYYQERNDYYKLNPQKAGKKIWGKEIVIPVFSTSNNCKDSHYR